MIWFRFLDKTRVFFINNTMNSISYIRLLNSALILFGNEILDNNYTFEQDNAPCHRAKSAQRVV